MHIPRLLTGFVLAAAASSVLPAQSRYFPLDQIKPGMTGTGLTVFEGERIERFDVQILGLLRNAAGPRRTVILARLAGGPLSASGVIAGMSGSPVYLEGRLVGALAYALGSFAKEPIAGITPIAEMIEAAEATAPRAPTFAAADLAANGRAGLLALLSRQLAPARPFADRVDDVLVGPAATGEWTDPYVALQLRPIDTPLTIAGAGDQGRRELSALLAPRGFVPVAGSPAAELGAAVGKDPAPLAPGAAVGIELISGDFSAGATGTVTDVDGSRVYAFGHSLYNLGPSQLPMHRAYVHALLPSLLTSTKLTSLGGVVGTFRQDRATVMAGTIDNGPPLLPVSLAVTSSHAPGRTFRFRVAVDQTLTPLLVYAAVANTLASYERSAGVATFALRGSARLRGRPALTFDDAFAGEAPTADLAASIALPLTALLGNEFAQIDVESLDLSVTATEQVQSSRVERAWLQADRIRAGSTVPLKVELRGYRGEPATHTLPIQIPPSAAGAATLLIADAPTLREFEQRELREPRPWTLDQLIAALGRTRRNNRLYVRLVGSAPGAVVNGEQLPALPPSVLAVYEAGRAGSSMLPLGSVLLGEWELPVEGAVTGSRRLSIAIESSR